MPWATYPFPYMSGTSTSPSGARTSTSTRGPALSVVSSFTSAGGMNPSGEACLTERGNLELSVVTRRAAGWWGHDPATRFDMPPVFARIRGAQGFQQSNPSVLATVSVLGSLEVFKKAGWMKPLRARSLRLTGYLEALLHASRFYVPVEQASRYSQSAANKVGVTIITPANPDDRGAQLSLVFLPTGRGVMPRVLKELGDRGVVGDSRKPDVIRIAPCALYNTFEDVERSVRMLEEALETVEVSGLGGSQ